MFYAKYFPNSVRYVKDVNFLNLVQVGMLESQYAEQFKHLGDFKPRGWMKNDTVESLRMV